MLASVYMGLRKVSERNLLIMFNRHGIDRNGMDDFRFNEILKIEVAILKNSILEICANICIALILILFVVEIY